MNISPTAEAPLSASASLGRDILVKYRQELDALRQTIPEPEPLDILSTPALQEVAKLEGRWLHEVAHAQGMYLVGAFLTIDRAHTTHKLWNSWSYWSMATPILEELERMGGDTEGFLSAIPEHVFTALNPTLYGIGAHTYIETQTSLYSKQSKSHSLRYNRSFFGDHHVLKDLPVSAVRLAQENRQFWRTIMDQWIARCADGTLPLGMHDPLYDTAMALTHYFGEAPQDGLAVAMLLRMNDSSLLMDWYFKVQHKYPLQSTCMLDHWEEAFAFPSGTMARLRDPDAFWGGSQWLWRHRRYEPLPQYANLKFSNALHDWSQRLVQHYGYVDIDHILPEFFQREPIDATLKVDQFSHLGHDRILQLVRGLAHSATPVRMLLWGDTGTGKTSLARVLSRESNRTMYRPPFRWRKEVGKKEKHESVLEPMVTFVHNVSALRQGSSSIALFDDCDVLLAYDQKHELLEFLDQQKTHEIWIANNIEHVDPAYLRRFNYVLHVPTMPLSMRKAFAERLIRDTHLTDAQRAVVATEQWAERIAVTCARPFEIADAWRWACTVQDFTWASTHTRKMAFEHAENRQEKRKAQQVEVRHAPQALTLDDFQGQSGARALLERLSTQLRHAAALAEQGVVLPKGCLLLGPPGCGKTYFMQVLSSVTQVPVVVTQGSAIREGPIHIREVFAQARALAPCVVFIDEIDVCARWGPFSTAEDQATLNRLLVEIDGFEGNSGVCVIGATHEKMENIAPPLRRSGRLSEILHFQLPDPTERAALWRHYLKPMGVHTHTPLIEEAVRRSVRFSPAEIQDACQKMHYESAIQLVQHHTLAPEWARLLRDTCDAVFWGRDQQYFLTDDTKRKIAVHEAGHALVATLMGMPVDRVSLKHTPGSYGAVALGTQEGIPLKDWKHVEQHVRVAFGGSAAETIVYDGYGDGGQQDRATVHLLLQTAWARSGLDPSYYAPRNKLEEWSNEARAQLETRIAHYSELAWKDTMRLLRPYRHLLVFLGERLLERRDVDGDEWSQLLAQWQLAQAGRRPPACIS